MPEIELAPADVERASGIVSEDPTDETREGTPPVRIRRAPRCTGKRGCGRTGRGVAMRGVAKRRISRRML